MRKKTTERKSFEFISSRHLRLYSLTLHNPWTISLRTRCFHFRGDESVLRTPIIHSPIQMNQGMESGNAPNTAWYWFKAGVTLYTHWLQVKMTLIDILWNTWFNAWWKWYVVRFYVVSSSNCHQRNVTLCHWNVTIFAMKRPAINSFERFALTTSVHFSRNASQNTFLYRDTIKLMSYSMYVSSRWANIHARISLNWVWQSGRGESENDNVLGTVYWTMTF